MRTHLLNSTSAAWATVAGRILQWMVVDAALGIVCGALFGIAFGACGLLLDAQSWSIISVASYFAVCGAAAGALVGVCGAVLEGGAVLEPACHSSSSSPPRVTAVAPVLDMPIAELTGRGQQSGSRLPHNRLFDVERRSQEASRDPSRN